METPPKTHWNHRVIRREQEFHGEKYVTYGIHEVYYTDGQHHALTMEPVAICGDSLDDIKQSLEWMTKALEAPVLDFDKDFPQDEPTDS